VTATTGASRSRQGGPVRASTDRCGPTRSGRRGRPSSTARHDDGPGSDGGCEMADLAYAVLLIGGFAVLVLMLRGLDSL